MNTRFVLAAMLLIQLMTACSQNVVVDAAPELAPDVTKEVTLNTNPEVVKKTPQLEIKPLVVEERSLAILVGRVTPDYQTILDTIEERFDGNTEVYVFNDETQSPDVLVSAIQQSSHRYVASIGQFATRQALKLEDKHVVFADVFTFEDEMAEKEMFGVSMLPNPDKLFSAWKNLNPALESVAIMTGPGNGDQVKVIAESASRYQIQLIHRDVRNDKEMLYQGEKLMSSVHGFWLLPDHRILSRRSMKEFMSLGLKKSKQVVVFNRQLLNYGGLIYIEADPVDVAEILLEQLDSDEIRLRYSSQVSLVVNPVVAQKLGLDMDDTTAQSPAKEQLIH